MRKILKKNKLTIYVSGTFISIYFLTLKYTCEHTFHTAKCLILEKSQIHLTGVLVVLLLACVILIAKDEFRRKR